MEKTEFACKRCQCYFDSLQECLRHDLLKHISLKRINEKSPHVTKLQQFWNTFEDRAEDRQKVHNVLADCKAGQELYEIFKIYCMDGERKDEVQKIVMDSLMEDLSSIKNIELVAFGSIENGLWMKNSDIDIYVRPSQSRNSYKNKTYYQIVEHLRIGQHFTDITPIPQARVSIIKCTHTGSGCKIDINCACADSVENTKFVREIFSFDVRLRSFMRFIKIWAKQHQLIGQGLMTCYCLTTLALFFLQQTHHKPSQPALVPSVQKMQSDEPTMLIQGINYAFNIYKHMVPVPADVHSAALIRAFFNFYHQFDFHRLMVATHLGATVSLADFESGKFHYAAYENQMTILKTTGFEAKVKPLCIDRDMIVQDSFQLNRNLAKSVTQTHFNYFSRCIEQSYRICMRAISDAQMYEALLFDRFDVDSEETSSSESMMSSPKQLCTFECTLSPNQHILQALYERHRQREGMTAAGAANRRTDDDDDNAGHPDAHDVSRFSREWTQRTIESIWTVFKKIYCLDIRVRLNTDESIRFDSGEALKTTMSALDEKSPCSWVITGSVDMWSGRKYRCIGSKTFVRYQQLLTKALMLERSKMSDFAIDFNVDLTMRTDDTYGVVKLEFTQKDGLDNSNEKKRMALQKFVDNFKTIMERINVEETYMG